MTAVTAPTITEFLLARIAEDEAAATALRRAMLDKGPAPAFHDRTVAEQRAQWPSFWGAFERYPNPARVLAECEAKRRIAELHVAYPVPQEMTYGTITACETCGHVDDAPAEWPCDTLSALAAVYADHEAFQEEWRP